MQETKSGLVPLNDILKYDFFIPSFQRGYRWTKDQVKDLLDDIWEFHLKKDKSPDEFYCLQPVVISEIKEKYHVIDGQQRLTTLYIIFTYLNDFMNLNKKNKFSIEYESRPGSANFLKSIDFNLKDKNIDYFHICQSYTQIEEWFEELGEETYKNDFLMRLIHPTINNVRIIWYEVAISEPGEAIEIFTRLNMGKIALTNSELVKALFLKQLEISSEWDRMEQSLRENEFWYFLQNDSIKYDNRIELLFDVIAKNIKDGNRISDDKYHTFRHFNNRLSGSNDVEIVWQEIKQHFQTLMDWYQNDTYYHLIGYLLSVGISIDDLLNEAKDKTKTEFILFLKGKIKATLSGASLKDLSYDDDKKLLRKVLLLFNILTILENSKSEMRFLFGRYKMESWDIEHIHSVTSEIPNSIAHQADWLREVHEFTNDPCITSDINDYFNQRPKTFETLYNEILSFYSEKGIINDINDLSNLALLDSGTNRGYKNAVFPIKRKIIIEKDEAGVFIPICTRNVFLKYYNKNVDQMSFWGETDRKAYKAKIINVIEKFIN